MVASLRSIQRAKAESPAARSFSESDLLESFPVEVRPLARRWLLPCLVGITEFITSRVLSHLAAKENGTIDPITIMVKNAAASLQVSPGMIRNLVARGELEAIHIERSVRIVKASLDAFIERKRQGNVR
jgi:excisionase family DNA binding protein